MRTKMVELGAPPEVVHDDGTLDIAALEVLGLVRRRADGAVFIGFPATDEYPEDQWAPRYINE